MLVDGVWYFIALAMVNFLNLAFYRAATEVQVRHISLFLPVATEPSFRLQRKPMFNWRHSPANLDKFPELPLDTA